MFPTVLVPFFVAAAGVPVSSDPFFLVEFYAFRGALLVLFVMGLYRLVKNEVTRNK